MRNLSFICKFHNVIEILRFFVSLRLAETTYKHRVKSGTFTAQSGNLCLPECKFDRFIDRDIYWSNSYFEIPSRIIINGQPKKKEFLSNVGY